MFRGPGHNLDLGRVHDLGHGRGCSHCYLVVVVEISKKKILRN